MKYYLIAGEASGDLHASMLMKALKESDHSAQFRFFGGDLMSKIGGEPVCHYRTLAYMGFIPVLRHLPTILKGMALCKRDIRLWQPDVVILVDYPGFNLGIAKYIHNTINKTTNDHHTAVCYYIPPKIWAWKEYRIKSIKKYVDSVLSILPFEVPFYEVKHHCRIRYVGNPTADEVRTFRAGYKQTFNEFCQENGLDSNKKIIALLAGSRQQEIKDNLPAMIEAASAFDDYQLVVAGAPSADRRQYDAIIGEADVNVVENKTFPLLSHATAALVTSGTATLETALFNVPQVVCYKTPLPHLIRFAFKHVIKVRYISLVNLIADKEIVKELLADLFTVDNMRDELKAVMPGGEKYDEMMKGYADMEARLGDRSAPAAAAEAIAQMTESKGHKLK